MPGGNGDATTTRLARQGYQEIILVMRVRASCAAYTNTACIER
jgi:hypothetical protein